MKKEWSNVWVSSKQPRKQRKYLHNAPLHVKHKLLSVHLAPVLRERYGTRAVSLRKGDKVKVMRGSSKGFNGTVDRISLKKLEVFIEDLKVKKVDGTEVLKSMKPSNLMITELNTDDKKRQAKLLRGGKPSGKTKTDKSKETKEASPVKEPKKKTEKPVKRKPLTEKKTKKTETSKEADKIRTQKRRTLDKKPNKVKK